LVKLASFHAADAAVGPMVKRAKALGLRTRIHGNAAMALEAGAIMAADVVEWSPELTAGFAEAAVVWAICPAADWWRGVRPMPARAQLDGGVALAIASGLGVDGNPISSLPAAMSVACLELRLTPAEAITACTINAAFAVGRAGQVGTLAPGKLADVLVLDAHDYRDIAMQLGTNLVTTVLRGGLPLSEDVPHRAAAPLAS
jgi:imidazolonepropionase